MTMRFSGTSVRRPERIPPAKSTALVSAHMEARR